MAARIPDRRLEQTARQLLWLIAIGLAAYGVALMHDLADGPLPRTLRSLVAVLTVSVGGVGALIVASKAEKALKRVRALAVPRSRLLPGDDAQATITPSPPADHGGRPGLYDTLTARVALKRAAAAARTAVPGLAPLDPTAQRRGRAGLRIGRGRARARTLAAYLATHDAPCPQCGYLLRGLTSMKCPECGLPLRLDTVRPDPAESTYISEYEAVDWVRSWWLVVTIVVFVITMVAMILNK